MITELQETAVSAAHRLAGKYLTFTLGRESYGIDVVKVREINRLTKITPVPQMPDYVRGVLNLRGKIVSIIDLRLRFGFTEITNTDQTCIVVVQAKLSGDRTVQIGLIVDGVEEVTHISESEIEQPPDFGSAIAMDYILGMAKFKGTVKMLLNIDKVVSDETLTLLQQPPVK